MKRSRSSRILAAAISIVLVAPARGQITNSWIDGDGKWEVGANWSLGIPPNSNQSCWVTIPDPCSICTVHTVTIDVTTTNSPSTMTIASLTISSNTLQLINAGSTPLHILHELSFTNGPATLIVSNSNVQVDGVTTICPDLSTNNMTVALPGGSMKLASDLLIKGMPCHDIGCLPGSVFINGGTVNVSSNFLVGIGYPFTSTVSFVSCTFNVTNGVIGIGTDLGLYGGSGAGMMTVSNAVVTAKTILVDSITGSHDVLTIKLGGVVNVLSNLAVGIQDPTDTSTVFIVGGTLNVSNGVTTIGSGQLTMSNGNLRAYSVNIGGSTNSNPNAALNLLGGTMNVLSNLTVGIGPNCCNSSVVTVASAILDVSNGLIAIGDPGTITSVRASCALTVSNAVVTAKRVTLDSGAGGTAIMTLNAGSTLNVLSNLVVGIPDDTGTVGVYIVNGTLNVTNGNTTIGSGQITMSNGIFRAYSVNIGDPTSNSGTATLNLLGGTMSATNVTIGSGLLNDDNVLVANATLDVSNGTLAIGNHGTLTSGTGSSQMTITNANVTAKSVLLGSSTGGIGTLTIKPGGTMTVSSNLVVAIPCPLPCSEPGIVSITGGSLNVTNATHTATLDVGGGTVTVFPGGILRVDKLIVTNASGHVVNSGGTLLYNQLVLDPNLSAVGDGIPNGWKQHYGFDPFDPTVANADSDGTGFSNLQQSQAGFNPTNPAAYLHVISIVKSVSNVTIKYLGANGDITWSPGIASRTNILEFTAGLGNGSYSNGGWQSTGQTNILFGGTGLGVITNMVDIGCGCPERYYRVRVPLP